MGDVDTEKEFKALHKLGYTMNTKTIMSFKNKDKDIKIKCSNCGHENLETISMGYNKKSNSDVELTLDAVAYTEPNSEALIFSGDGDFEYLVKYLVDKKGMSVYIISDASKTLTTGRRFSSKLRALLKSDKVHFINLNSWKKIIEKSS